MKLSKFDIHNIVEYIRSVGVQFDAVDVEEDITRVLWQYGYYDGFSADDLDALKRELHPLGLRHELAEVARSFMVEPEVC